MNIFLAKQPNTTLNKMKVGDKVKATITKSGYFISVYNGTVVGFTKNNRVKVKSYRGVKIHARHNVELFE